MVVELTKEHSDFLNSEFGVTDIDALDDGAFFALYNKVVDIETEEFGGSDGTKRGELAAAIVDYMADQFEYGEAAPEISA